MPYYDYKCNQCGLEQTLLLLSRDEVPKCEKCESTQLYRQIPKGTSFQLKGRGWFKSDYGKGGGSDE